MKDYLDALLDLNESPETLEESLKRENEELHEKIEQLKSPPFIMGTVVKTFVKIVRSEGAELFKNGTLVRIHKNSKFLSNAKIKPGEIGSIIGNKLGWYYVEFPESKFTNRYLIADLELADPKVEEQALIVCDGRLLQMSLNGITAEAGDTVSLKPGTYQVIEASSSFASGTIAYVRQIIDNEQVEVDVANGRKVIFSGKFSGKLCMNDRVVLNSTEVVVIQNLGVEDDSFSITDDVDITFDDIVGQEEAKARLLEAIEGVTKLPKHYNFFKKKPPSGFLLFGPPGCGKSMFGKAVYSAIIGGCKEKGANPSGGFILISGPEVLDKYVGVAEATIRHIFARARKFHEKYGVSPIIFIDEAEALLAKRDSGVSSDVFRTIVPTFLSEMQGVKSSGAIVILATNKPELLDYAVIRPGRMDVKVEIKRPGREEAKAIILKRLKGIPLSPGSSLEELAEYATSVIFSEELKIFEIECIEGEKKYFTLANIMSGAMISTFVEEEVKRSALLRESSKNEPTEGIRKEDIDTAVKKVFEQSFAANHEEAFSSFAKDFKDKIVGIKKLRQSQA